jgi:hypothetical protein
MTAASDAFRLGFFAAIEDPERGVIGGLLVTNRFGRPLEFQCTTPVKPNRTQEILYGPTLKTYVLTDVVGRTLVEKVMVKPDILLTPSPDLLELRPLVTMPVASVSVGQKPDRPDTHLLAIGQQWLEFSIAYPKDRAEAITRVQHVPDTADLQEPFDRIREALAETWKSSMARSA